MKHWVIFIILSCHIFVAEATSIDKVDFDVSMGKQSRSTYNFMFRHKNSAKYYHTFKTIFNNNFDNSTSKKLQIPKVMHQLWIGSPIPKFFEQYIHTCKEQNPGWEYRLWTEKELQKLSYNKDIIKALSSKKNVTKDYFMHLILQKFGGVFLDIDYVCFKPFELLNYKYDAWFVLEPSGWWKKIPTTSYSIIAAKPGHSIISGTLNDIEKYALDKKFRAKHNQEYSDKSIAADKVFGSIQVLGGSNIYKYCQKEVCSNIMVYPSTYFLPRVDVEWMLDNFQKYSLLDKIKVHFGLEPYPKEYFEIKPETIAMNDFNAKKLINPLYYKEIFHP